jgi:hypothetical protein
MGTMNVSLTKELHEYVETEVGGTVLLRSQGGASQDWVLYSQTIL